MSGAVFVAIGVVMWVLAFTGIIPGPAGYLFLFIGGLLIGSGFVQAVTR